MAVCRSLLPGLLIFLFHFIQLYININENQYYVMLNIVSFINIIFLPGSFKAISLSSPLADDILPRCNLWNVKRRTDEENGGRMLGETLSSIFMN